MTAFVERKATDYPASLLPGTWWQMDTGTRLQITSEPFRVKTGAAGKNRVKVEVLCGACGDEFERRLASVVKCISRCLACDGTRAEEAARAA